MWLQALACLGMSSVFMEAKFKNDQKLPKWNRWSRMGKLIGFSYEQSTLVATVQNLKKGYISPQYNVVSDDFFENTV